MLLLQQPKKLEKGSLISNILFLGSFRQNAHFNAGVTSIAMSDRKFQLKLP